MATNGHRPAETGDRKRALIIGAVIAALLVFGLGYLLGSGGDDQAAVSPTATSPAPTSLVGPTCRSRRARRGARPAPWASSGAGSTGGTSS